MELSAQKQGVERRALARRSGRSGRTELGVQGRPGQGDRNSGIPIIPPQPWSRPSPGLDLPGLPGVRNAGSPSGVGGNPLAPLPGHTLVPGWAIFGPPRPVFDKKGTAAGHFPPQWDPLFHKGLELWSPGPPRAQGWRVVALLPRVTMHLVFPGSGG